MVYCVTLVVLGSGLDVSKLSYNNQTIIFGERKDGVEKNVWQNLHVDAKYRNHNPSILYLAKQIAITSSFACLNYCQMRIVFPSAMSFLFSELVM